MLPVLRNVELSDRLFVEVNRSNEWIIEPLHELNRRTLSTPRGTDKRNVGTRLDSEVEVAQDTNTGAGGVPKVNILEPNPSPNVLRHLAFIRLRVDIGDRIDEVDDIGCGAFGRGHIRYERKDVSGLDRPKHGALKRDEELKGAKLLEGHQSGAVPEHKRDDEEGHGLSERIQKVASERRLVRLAQGAIETLAVQDNPLHA